MRRAAGLIAAPAALLALLALVVVLNDDERGASCTVRVAGLRDARLDSAQVANARIIVGVARQHELPMRAAVIAVAAAKQESDLRNLRYGDRDSLGLFQQRPSQGWGSREQLLDPVYAASAFYLRLLKVPDWPTLSLTDAAQAVQRSAIPGAYQQWQPLAQALVGGITGAKASSLTCQTHAELVAASGHESGDFPTEQIGADGLTPRTRTAMHAVIEAFGVTDVGGFCPGGCTTGHITGSDHYTGHAVDFMLLPMNQANRELGDRIASWLVANHDQLAVKYVIWSEQIWTPGRGWHVYVHPDGNTSDPTVRHDDHIHLSVW